MSKQSSSKNGSGKPITRNHNASPATTANTAASAMVSGSGATYTRNRSSPSSAPYHGGSFVPGTTSSRSSNRASPANRLSPGSSLMSSSKDSRTSPKKIVGSSGNQRIQRRVSCSPTTGQMMASEFDSRFLSASETQSGVVRMINPDTLARAGVQELIHEQQQLEAQVNAKRRHPSARHASILSADSDSTEVESCVADRSGCTSHSIIHDESIMQKILNCNRDEMDFLMASWMRANKNRADSDTSDDEFETNHGYEDEEELCSLYGGKVPHEVSCAQSMAVLSRTSSRNVTPGPLSARTSPKSLKAQLEKEHCPKVKRAPCDAASSTTGLYVHVPASVGEVKDGSCNSICSVSSNNARELVASPLSAFDDVSSVSSANSSVLMRNNMDKFISLHL